MVISDDDIEGIALDKPKAHTPLTVDADAPLPDSVTVQRFQTIGRRKSQVIHHRGVFELIQAKYGAMQDVRRQSAGLPGAKQAFGFLVGKAANHFQMINKLFTLNKALQRMTPHV